jgi:hypothetical protein
VPITLSDDEFTVLKSLLDGLADLAPECEQKVRMSKTISTLYEVLAQRGARHETVGGRSAFPCSAPPRDGMTYRQWLIGQALAGLEGLGTPDKLAGIAIQIADAVLAKLDIEIMDAAMEKEKEDGEAA